MNIFVKYFILKHLKIIFFILIFFGIPNYLPANDVQIESFIKRLYINIYEREPDQSGLNYWKNRLKNGMTATEVARFFYKSDEMKKLNLNNSEFLRRTYKTFFDRLPDKTGFAYWLNEMKTKRRDQIFYGFALSNEFKNICISYGIKAFSKEDRIRAYIERFYNLILQRDADEEGVKYWINELKNKNKSPKDVAKAFFFSPEFMKKKLSEKDFVKIAYETLLNRKPDKEGLYYWTQKLTNREFSKNKVLDLFLDSKEFRNITLEFFEENYNGHTQNFDIPNPPSNFIVLSTKTDSITLKWEDNSNNENGFKIYKEKQGVFTILATLPENTTKFKDINLQPNTTYNYKIEAFNDKGVSKYIKISVATLAKPPYDVWTTSKGCYEINLKWKAHSIYDEFNIYRDGKFIGSEARGSIYHSYWDDLYYKIKDPCNKNFKYTIKAVNIKGQENKDEIASISITPSPASSPDNGENVEEKLKTNYFIDSPVKGLTYICGDITGTTDEEGTFKCKTTPVTFKVWNLTIGTLNNFTSDFKVYPQDILGKRREDVEDNDVVELSRFLQVLDDDGDISRFINITPKIASKFTQKLLFGSMTPFERLKILTNNGISFKRRGSTTQHLTDTLSLNQSNLEKALTTEDASLIDENTLYNALEKEKDDSLNLCKATLNFIYPNGLERTTFPATRSDYFSSTSPNNIPLHVAKNSGDYRVYSYIGEKPLLARYAVLGANIFAFDSKSGYSDITNDLNKELKNSTIQLLKWLMKKSINEDIFNENLTIIVNSNTMKNDLNKWLTDNNLQALNWNISTDTSLLNSGDFDLYIARDERSTNYKTAIEHHKPVIVFENWIHPNDDMLAYFGIKWRWYTGITVGDFDSIDELCKTTDKYNNIFTTIKNLKDGSLNFNYNDTACTSYVGTVTCQNNLLLNSNGKTLGEEFMNGATKLKNIIEEKDKEGVNIFNLPHEYDFLKMAILLGDKYRANIHYPMDKIATDDTTFYKALFADYSVHYAREKNKPQPDMGDFITNVSTIISQPTITKEVTMTPTKYGEWSASGLFALPGKTIIVRRKDNSNNSVKIKFNMLRTNTTRIWNENSYSRPRFMQSNSITIEKGKDYKISTPYGGPIYIYWKGVESNAVPFTLEFENVAQHLCLLDLSSNSINNFKNQIDNSPYEWIDIKTPYVEIHTLKSKFQEAYTTAGDFPYNGNLTQYLKDIDTYLIKSNLNLAGFKGDGLSLNSDVQNWCSNYNLDCTGDIHKKPKIQHINSDIHAACGAGCSGNPFDISWALTPIGWGESHEYGHNLQRSRLKIYGGRSTEVSNNIFPLHTKWRYIVDHNIDVYPNLKRPNTEETYTILQNAIRNNIPASINHPLWAGSGTYDNAFERLTFYEQLVFVHNSWDIYTKLYIVERLFTDAISDDTKWNENKDKLGFSSYTREEASDINGNDFMAIVLSKFTNKDHTEYFEKWGIELSQKAKDQISANNPSSSVPLEYYWIDDNKLTKDFPTKTLPLDGVEIQEVNVSGICNQSILSQCNPINGIAEFDTPNSGSIYFLSRWSENGPTNSINSGNEGYTTITVNAKDDLNNTLTIKLRAAKTTSNDGIDGSKIAMNDTAQVSASKTSLVVWINPSDNTLDNNRVYTITESPFIDVKHDTTTIKRIKLNIKDLIVPTSLTYNDISTPFIRSFPKIENSSTYFVTTSPTQGPTKGKWSFTSPSTKLYVKVKDDNNNEYTLTLRAKRDGFRESGTSGYYNDINSGGNWGGATGNALIIWYDSSDNPQLSSNTHYISKELLVIDAKLWHANDKLRERMYIKVDITTPN